MPVQIEVDQEQRIVTEIFTGDIEIEELVAIKEVMLSGDPLPGYSMIADMSGARLLCGLEDVDRLIQVFRDHADILEHTRIALVVENNTDTALAYMYRELAEKNKLGFEVEVFSTLDSAKRWIGTFTKSLHKSRSKSF